MNSKTLKHWIANAMFAMVVSTLTMSAPNISYAKSSTVQVQDSYTIDELYTLIKSKYPDAEKLNDTTLFIKIGLFDNKIFLSLPKPGTTLSFRSFWDPDEKFSLKELNQINAQYKFGKVYLDDDGGLIIKCDIDLEGASKDYILQQLKRIGVYHTLIVPKLFE